MSKKAAPEFGDESGPSLHSARWRFGEFELDETRRELRLRGELLKIEAKPLNLLMLFLRHPGEMITKNDLIDALWTGRIVSEAVLGNCVAKLRQVLGDDGAALIKTVFGFGYRFDVEAQLLSDDAVTVAPPKLPFQSGDSPPMRPNWKLIRRLGRSGDCWLAEHTKTRAQRVFKFTTELHGLSALKREVTVYRLLHESLGDKACYVDLLDWNFDQPPWFVEAEYCAAGSLQEWFTTRGGVERIPLSARLELIAQIAEALAEIHAVGILHKDLKPANVFVVLDHDGQPTIRLADFGSSRLYDSEYLARLQITKLGFTQMLDPNQGESSGTPLYLAPEVVAGQPATVKADIYALGVMLYQFVTGNLSRRLEAGWEAAVDDEILREDINAAADGDPQRRLADPRELARKLRAVEARRSARRAEHATRARSEYLVRASERAKARRIGLAFAAASLVIGMVTTSVFAWRANEARQHAEKEAARARAVGEFLAGGMFANINGEVKKVRELTVKELIDRAVARIPAQFETDPDVKAELHAAFGKAYDALDYNIDADAQLAEADALIVANHGPRASQRLSIAIKRILLNFALGRLRENLAGFEAIAETADIPDVESRRARDDLQLELLRAQMLLGRYDHAVDRARVLLATPRPDNERFLLGVKRLLGSSLYELAEMKESRAVLQAALAEEVRLNGSESRGSIAILCNLALAEIELGSLDSAAQRLDSAQRLAEQWLQPGFGWVNVIAVARAKLKYMRGSRTEAIEAMVVALDDIRHESKGGYDQSIVMSIHLVELYNYERRFSDSEALTTLMLAHLENQLAPDAVRLARIRLERAYALVGLQRVAEASALVRSINSQLGAQLSRKSPFFERLEFVKYLIESETANSMSLATKSAQLSQSLGDTYFLAHPLINELNKRATHVARSP